MTPPDIHTGSAILQARGSVIADMARVQNQTTENVVKSIQGISDSLHRWQDRLDKQAQLKADNDYRNATLDEQRRINDANIQKLRDDEAYRQDMKEDERDKLRAAASRDRAQARLANSQAKIHDNENADWQANKKNTNAKPNKKTNTDEMKDEKGAITTAEPYNYGKEFLRQTGIQNGAFKG